MEPKDKNFSNSGKNFPDFNEPVTLVIAKRLKKLGFSEPTRAFYLIKPLPYVPVGLCWERNGRRRNMNNVEDDKLRKIVVSAPDYKQATEFLLKLEQKNRISKKKLDIKKTSIPIDIKAHEVFTGNCGTRLLNVAHDIILNKPKMEIMLSDMPPLSWFEAQDGINKKSLWVYEEIMKEHGFLDKLQTSMCCEK